MAERERGSETRALYEHILVPTDGSEGASRGVKHGIDLGRQYGATIHVLNVLDERRQVDTPALSSDELVFEKLEEQGMEILDAVADDAREVALETVVECCRGVPHDEILAYVEDNDVDLVVMGVHGDGRSGRPHVGSTTERVLQSSKVPVFPV